MSPFLNYSGRGRSHRGRGRAGRGAVSRGRGRAGRIPGGRSSIDRVPYACHETSVYRRGNFNKHKWIRSDKSAEVKDGVKNDEEPESKSIQLMGNGSVATTDEVANGSNNKKEEDECLSLPQYSHTIMQRKGQHKLILSSKTKNRPVASKGVAGDSSLEIEQQQPATQGQSLRREGKNKLVPLMTSNAAKPKDRKQESSMNSRSMDTAYNGFHGRQKKIRSIGGKINLHTKLAPPSKPAVKRVKLSAQPRITTKEQGTISCNKQEDVECHSQSFVSKSQIVGSKSEPTEKFSDFAYKEVSRVRQRPIVSSYNLHWSKESNNKSSSKTDSDKTSLPSPTPTGKTNKRQRIKNMGLVRIQPDEKTTPICPTFLRGKHCQNQYCRKRHDIPKEYTLPVCWFFQRHGQCMRGVSCVFRHVKLNANAIVCPSFAVLGFCEDEKCKMQHVHGQKGINAVGANGTCTIATEQSSSRFRRNPKNVYYRNKSTSSSRDKDR